MESTIPLDIECDFFQSMLCLAIYGYIHKFNKNAIVLDIIIYSDNNKIRTPNYTSLFPLKYNFDSKLIQHFYSR